MITIQICVGSSCFVKGKNDVVKSIQFYLKEHRLESKVLLKGSFCLEHCEDGVTLMIDDKLFTGINKSNLPELLNQKVLTKLKEE